MNNAPMNSNVQRTRRLLIVDDQRHIHETFSRIFDPKTNSNDALKQFENRFLNAEQQTSDMDDAPMASPTYDLSHATCCEEAVALTQEAMATNRPFSVAFVDMRMPPGKNGIETTEELWKISPDLQVVICTAHSDEPWSDVLARLGYSDRLLLLKKPFESDEAKQLALALSEKHRLSMIRGQQIDVLTKEVKLRRRVEDELRDMAERDTLTKLPNRSFLVQRLREIISRRRLNANRHDAVLFLDLDNFKIINDSLGHDAGDDLLNQVAARLQQCVRKDDTASRCINETGECTPDDVTIRLGGDEFVIVLECMNDPDDAIRVANRVVSQIAEPFELGDRIVNVGTSVGVAFINQQVPDGNAVLRNADTAMYQAKTKGKGCVAVFDQTMHEAVCRRLEMEDQLRRAVDQGDFTLEYQPIIELQSGRIAGVETLLRWKDASGLQIPPNEFVPIMEEIGLITYVGEWVIEKASREFGQMVDALPEHIDPDVYLGVNLSTRQLNDQGFLHQLKRILDRTNFDPNRLKLEMRESLDARSSGQSLNCMNMLKDSGIGLHIDDFGKGRSSLMCFQTYPVETVKIDRSFTAGIVEEKTHAVMTRAIIDLAHQLGAQIVAEGVESEAQLNLLRGWGCDLAQGYLLAQPLSLDALRDLLSSPLDSNGIEILRRPFCPISPAPPVPFVYQ